MIRDKETIRLDKTRQDKTRKGAERQPRKQRDKGPGSQEGDEEDKRGGTTNKTAQSRRSRGRKTA